MKKFFPRKSLRLAHFAFVAGVIVLVAMAVLSWRDARNVLSGKGDTPPHIEFTWSPAGAVSLRDMRGMLSITDDRGIDFTTYRMHLVELDKTIDLPIPGIIGREYSQPISFSLIADHPRLVGKDKLTVEISVADDKGQVSTLTRVIDLKR